jgi:NOL1/NOP2/sun family putative RNA methylase
LALNLPEEFRSKITQLLGSEAEAFFSSYSNPRYQALRINPLKLSPEDFRELVSWKLTPVPWADGGFYYDPGDHPGKSPLHEAGLYYIQEPSAMIVGALSGVRPGERVLDLCAAPGGKSTHLAGQMKGQGLLVSNEIHPQRARILSRNIERFGITNAIVTNETPKHLAEHFPSFFDRIVVDAPCSGEGMFRKEEAALTDWSQDNVLHCAERQKGILESADQMLKTGGTLVYSTCTFSKEENEDNIARFLKHHPEYTQIDMPSLLKDKMNEWGLSAGLDEKSLRLWPHKLHGEGHFFAALKKSGIRELSGTYAAGFDGTESSLSSRQPDYDSLYLSQIEAEDSGLAVPHKKNKKNRHSASYSSENKRKKKTNSRDASRQSASEIWSVFAEDTFQKMPIFSSDKPLLTFGDELYLLPANVSLTGLKVLRPGLDLGTVKKNRFEPSHALALSLKKEDLKHTLDLTYNSREVQAYLHGESLPCEEKGWTAVTVNGYPLGWGKASGGILKNHYPKGLRTQF